jgi:hypothetical protein
VSSAGLLEQAEECSDEPVRRSKRIGRRSMTDSFAGPKGEQRQRRSAGFQEVPGTLTESQRQLESGSDTRETHEQVHRRLLSSNEVRRFLVLAAFSRRSAGRARLLERVVQSGPGPSVVSESDSGPSVVSESGAGPARFTFSGHNCANRQLLQFAPLEISVIS